MSYSDEDDIVRAIGILLAMAVLAIVFIPQQLLNALIHGLIEGAIIALIIVAAFLIKKYMEDESGW
ncbi:MAG: hypothetical protein AT710_02945 [Thermocladium sp. ECH_B]|nr:MAG: hypothetical protein AT710_02945 [Thermocladium sp. ECH_B]